MRSTTTIDPPTLTELSSIAAENNPARAAFGNGIDGDVVTWAEFDEDSARAANAIRDHAGQGDRVAFLCEGSVEHTTLWNGALKAGCIVSNLHVRASPNTIRDCIDSLRPQVLVVDEETSELFETKVRESITTDLGAVVSTGQAATDYEHSYRDFLADRPATDPDVRVRPDDTAVVMWTSGTTGKPKGWCNSHRGLAMRGLKLAHTKGADRLSNLPNVFTPSFAAWYSTVLPAMVTNASTYFLRSWDPETYVELIQERSITSCNLVPTMWREILRLDDLDEYDLTSLVNIQSAGEALDRTTLERLRENICDEVWQSYAATEAVGTAISHVEMDGDRIESVGKPMVGTRVRVVERGGSSEDVLPPGELGEIILKSSDSATWVWGNTPKTESTFEDGWWFSGDLGYKDEEGYLFIEGRDDNMIISKGIKVFPTPVEERLNAHPDVVESAVFGVSDEEYGEMVTAYVQRSNADLTAADLDQWCLDSDDLSRIERPREYHFTEEELPRTASDKLDRKSLQRQVNSE